jgi:hypothetical protein
MLCLQCSFCKFTAVCVEVTKSQFTHPLSRRMLPLHIIQIRRRVYRFRVLGDLPGMAPTVSVHGQDKPGSLIRIADELTSTINTCTSVHFQRLGDVGDHFTRSKAISNPLHSAFSALRTECCCLYMKLLLLCTHHTRSMHSCNLVQHSKGRQNYSHAKFADNARPCSLCWAVRRPPTSQRRSPRARVLPPISTAF